jgi:hypothetical protein
MLHAARSAAPPAGLYLFVGRGSRSAALRATRDSSHLLGQFRQASGCHGARHRIANASRDEGICASSRARFRAWHHRLRRRRKLLAVAKRYLREQRGVKRYGLCRQSCPHPLRRGCLTSYLLRHSLLWRRFEASDATFRGCWARRAPPPVTTSHSCRLPSYSGSQESAEQIDARLRLLDLESCRRQCSYPIAWSVLRDVASEATSASEQRSARHAADTHSFRG